MPILTDTMYDKIHIAPMIESDGYYVYTYELDSKVIQSTINLIGTKLPTPNSCGETDENRFLIGAIVGIVIETAFFGYYQLCVFADIYSYTASIN